MLRFFSLSRRVCNRLISATNKNNRIGEALWSTSTKKSAKASNIFINQYVRTCGTKTKGLNVEPTNQSNLSQQHHPSKIQNIEPDRVPSEDFIKYHTLYKLIKKIEGDTTSALYLGDVAKETGLVPWTDYYEEDLEKMEKVDPNVTAMRSAIKNAYKSFSFAFDIGESGLYNFSLHVRSADGQLVDCGTIGYGLKLNTEVLKQHCVPAPYGDLKSMTTKVDPEVRSALTIDYDKLVITKKETKPSYSKADNPQEDHYNKELQNLLSRVQEEFQDDTLYLEPYKLNMYEEGGFFKPHVDTPRYENMVGTLVVRLKDAEGGHLIIRHRGETFEESGPVTAFFCDREHEITPVTKGTRVALTFNICKDSPSVAKSDQAITLTRTTPLVKDHNIASLIKAIKESPFKKIGLLTEFDYTQKGISLQSLKGNDRIVLEELLKEPSFKIDLLPTVVKTSYFDNSHLKDESPTEYNSSGEVYRLLTEDLERMKRGEQAPKTEKEDEVVFFRVKDGLEVYEHEQRGAECTGNEALYDEIDNIYFNGAIVVTDLNPKSTRTIEKTTLSEYKEVEEDEDDEE